MKGRTTILLAALEELAKDTNCQGDGCTICAYNKQHLPSEQAIFAIKALHEYDPAKYPAWDKPEDKLTQTTIEYVDNAWWLCEHFIAGWRSPAMGKEMRRVVKSFNSFDDAVAAYPQATVIFNGVLMSVLATKEEVERILNIGPDDLEDLFEKN